MEGTLKRLESWIIAACVAAATCLACQAKEKPVASEEPAAPVAGETVLGALEVTATVTAIDPETREVTLQTEDGEEYSLVADEAVKNLAQVNVGDVVTATYVEALAYEVKKGGEAGAEATVAAGAAEPGAKPAGVVADQIKVTVTIEAIDPSVPSVTFKGPEGNTRTIRVLHPEKLEGVSVGDTVEITYTEALAMKVEEAPEG